MMTTSTRPSRPVRVRIAPSPTGNLHVGTARTALFNYLFAKHHGGTFVLRVEDTDLERSKPEFTQNIFDGLRALGLQWDEGPDVGGPYGPYTQTERLERYKEVAHQLLAQGLAYWDYTSPDTVDALRAKATEAKQPFVYRPAPLSEAQQAEAKAAGIQPSLRFRIPQHSQPIVVHDLVRGDVSVEADTLGDLVLLKSDGTAAYNFAVVVDDADMRISHVIRGEDHLPNTPKQLLLYQALGWEPPAFAHLGMILAPDRSKLSKRHGATAVAEFVEHQGYLPHAFINFLALLGWSSPAGDELMSLETLIEQFSLDRIAHGGAIFDVDKLKWMNSHYIRQLSPEALAPLVAPYLQAYPIKATYTPQQWCLLLEAVQEPLTTLSQITEDVAYFFGDTVAVPDALWSEVLETDEGRAVLTVMLADWLPALDVSTLEATAASLKHLTKTLLKDYKTKTVMWTLRACTTGRVQGADLSKTLHLLGLNRVALRLKAAGQRLGIAV